MFKYVQVIVSKMDLNWAVKRKIQENVGFRRIVEIHTDFQDNDRTRLLEDSSANEYFLDIQKH